MVSINAAKVNDECMNVYGLVFFSAFVKLSLCAYPCVVVYFSEDLIYSKV